MVVLNDIVGKNLKIYQDDDYFKFSLESVLLPNFVNINLRDKKILDLCSGNCPIPLILSLKTKAHIYAVELQKEVYELGIKSININNKQEQITLSNQYQDQAQIESQQQQQYLNQEQNMNNYQMNSSEEYQNQNQQQQQFINEGENINNYQITICFL